MITGVPDICLLKYQSERWRLLNFFKANIRKIESKFFG